MTFHRKKSFWAVLFILLLNIAAVQPIRVGFTQLPPEIHVDPPEIKDESYGVGSTFTVDINIVGAENIYGYQINMTFNPEVLNTTVPSIVEGWFLSDFFASTVFTPAVNNAAGFLLVSGSEFPPYSETGAFGDGLLMSITFKVKVVNRGTLLQFVKGTKLYTVIGGNPVEIVDFSTFDGSFDNRPVSQNVFPVAFFEVEPLDAGRRGEVRFDASGSSDPDAWLMSYHWDYGDGTEEVYMREPYGIGNFTAKPAHVFYENGTFTVTLTVKDNDNATDDATALATVLFDLAVVDVESPFIVVMPGVQVTVDVTVENNGDFYESFNVTAYYNETLIELQHVASMAPWTQQVLTFNWDTTGLAFGNYVLKANATILAEETDAGNNVYVDGSVIIASSNVVDFELLVGGVTFHVVTSSISVVSGLGFSPVEKKLSFDATGQEGAGTFCNITIPIELLGGNYTVLHNGVPVAPEPQEIANGTHTFLYFTFTHTSSDMIEIIGETAATPPVAIIMASKTNPLVDELVTFDASDSYDSDGAITGWSWEFGDGEVASDEVVQHSYSSFGNYTVTLTVSDGTYTNSTQTTIRALDYPTVMFTYSPPEPLVNETVSFDAATSLPKGGSITDYSWNFGDGQTGAGSIVTHSYSATGAFTVTLALTDSEGLANSTSKTVTVTIHNVAVTSVTASPDALEKGGTITLQITASNRGNYTESFTVTAYYNTTAIKTESVTGLNPGGEQSITVAWNTINAPVGTYVLKAEASAVDEETMTSDNSLIYGSVTVQKITSALSVTASSTTVTLGRNTIIHGTLGPARIGTSITIQYRLSGGEWAALATVISDAQAQYMLNWRPQESGTYEIQAIWLGDADTKPCQSTTETVTVQEGGGMSSESILTYGGIIAAIVALILLTLYLLRLRKK
jgi:PKD repeat protein